MVWDRARRASDSSTFFGALRAIGKTRIPRMAGQGESNLRLRRDRRRFGVRSAAFSSPPKPAGRPRETVLSFCCWTGVGLALTSAAEPPASLRIALL